MSRLMLVVLCALLSWPLAAQQRLEIIPLKHRLPDQILPTLKPLLEPGATLSAMNGKLFVRASPVNIEELRRALAAIDTPTRSLMIYLRQGRAGLSEDVRLGLDGQLLSRNGELSVDGRALARADAARSSSNIVQKIQTMEDGEAWIYLGKSLPIPMLQRVYGPGGSVATLGTQYVDVGSGFSVRPQLSGDQLSLQISPQNQGINRNGVIEGGRLSTTLRGRLGEWLPLGGGTQQADFSERGMLSNARGHSEQSSEYWIKVEVMD